MIVPLIVFQASENLITGKKTYKLKHNIPLAQAWVTPPSAYYTSPPENSKLQWILMSLNTNKNPHPWGPRGSQSGWQTKCNKRF